MLANAYDVNIKQYITLYKPTTVSGNNMELPSAEANPGGDARGATGRQLQSVNQSWRPVSGHCVIS